MRLLSAAALVVLVLLFFGQVSLAEQTSTEPVAGRVPKIRENQSGWQIEKAGAPAELKGVRS
jgi:hypothetical protein